MAVAAFPFDQLPRVSRDGLAGSNALARWLAVRPLGRRVATLVGGDATLAMRSGALEDLYAATCEVRVQGQTVFVRGASAFVRAFAQRVLGGPEEVTAPRPLTDVEQSMWVLLVAAAIEDLGIDGEVWDSVRGPGSGAASSVVLDARFAGKPCAIELRFSPSLVLAAPPARPLPAWAARQTDVPIVVGRCSLAREEVGRLRTRSVITLDRPLGTAELVVLDGAIGLRADSTDPLVARVATEYVPRAMALPEDARVELTVGVGTARLSLRQILGLAIGETIPLGRPLAGPFEIRADGTLIGQGELVDVDGELGVRIVSLAQE